MLRPDEASASSPIGQWTGKSRHAMLGLVYGLLVIKEPLRKLENIYDLPNQYGERQLTISGVRDICAFSPPRTSDIRSDQPYRAALQSDYAAELCIIHLHARYDDPPVQLWNCGTWGGCLASSSRPSQWRCRLTDVTSLFLLLLCLRSLGILPNSSKRAPCCGRTCPAARRPCTKS